LKPELVIKDPSIDLALQDVAFPQTKHQFQ
jgi:hypothetical protein